jgi:Alpha/beta hydrolase of unknown function (DUF900)
MSDPDIPNGSAPNPNAVFERMPGFRITLYVSPEDKALATSGWLFGSIFRVECLNQALLTPEHLEHLRSLGFIDVIEVQSKTDLFGHSYFHSNPPVSSDLIAMLRYAMGPGDPGRSLELVEKPFWRIPERQGAGAAR